MLPKYFDYTLVHLRQKVRLRPELSPKILLTLSPNLARTLARPEKPGPTYNSDKSNSVHSIVITVTPKFLAINFAHRKLFIYS